ncbi:MAG: VTT domain-containing protein [Lachnospiraceae bacterium]|nr:VTT domain-containing protein [Lachnospiraceae bacterium]
MKKKVEKAVILISLVTVLVLFSFFLRDILVPFIRLELDNDLEGARRLLISRGVLGFFTVTLVEALQMVVIFIPAEFIQISSGLSYPFPVAVLLCDLGVCLGATIIFILVRTFRFDNAAYAKNREKIDKFSAAARKEKSVAFLMFFLFLMPLIPFGAICYYGSSTKIRYREYILTVAIGVIPSIVTSNLMGAAAKAFIRNDIPIPLLVLIIALLAAILFVLIFLFLDRIWFKENDCTPDSPIYTAFFRFVHLLRGPQQRLHLSGIPEEGFRAPYIMLCNHESFYDFYYVSRLDRDHNPAYVVNKYYLTRPFIRKLTKKAGFIPKKLFNPDFSTVGGIIKTVKGGHPVVIFPEARLSPDGRSNPIIEKGAGLYKKLDTDIILVKISGAYYARPKWRKTFYRSDINVSVERIIKAEEAKTIPDEELDLLIENTLRSCAVMPAGKLYHHRNLAEGLQNVLYRCADCGSLYTTRGIGNDLICTVCGAKRSFDGQYRFSPVSGNIRMTAAGDTASGSCKGTITSIADYYDRIRELELEELDSLELRTGAAVKIFNEKGVLRTREHGTCVMTPDTFSYTPDTGEGFVIDMDKLTAIPFSCAEEFELYHRNEQYYFYPDTDRIQAARWALAADLLREQRAGKGGRNE